MKKNKISFILIMFISVFSFLGVVEARERLVCKYTYDQPIYGEIEGYQYIETYQIELIFFLKDDSSELESATYSVIPDSTCKSKNIKYLNKSNREAEKICAKTTEDIKSRIKTIFTIQEGSDCPEYIDGYEPSGDLEITKNGSVYKFKTSNRDLIGKVNCGNITNISKKIPQLTSLAFTIIQILVPVLLVIMGSLDLFKGITANKEDEIKKGQQMFIKRLVVGVIIFFVIAITRFLVSVIASADADNISSCISCFVNNDCN